MSAGALIDLPPKQSELIERFSQDLYQRELVPDYWTDGLKNDFESVLSIPLQPGQNILLATVVSASEEHGRKDIALPLINPILDTSGSQASHGYTSKSVETLGYRCNSYLSLYLWHTTNHTPSNPHIVGLCTGGDFSPPYDDVRRVHIEAIVRNIPFLRLFGVHYEYKSDDGYTPIAKEFL